MSWGISAWGLSPWGGVFLGPSTLLTAPAFVNSRPYPAEITPVFLLSGGTNNLILDSPAQLEEDFYNGAYLICYGPPYVAVRRIEDYLSGREVVLERDFPYAIPSAAVVFIYADDTWIPDLLHMGIRPSADKALELPTFNFIHAAGDQSFDGLREGVTIGDPRLEHSASSTAAGSDQYIVLDSTVPDLPAGSFTTEDSFKGLTVTITRNRAAGEVRRITRYDAINKRAYVDKPYVVAPDSTSYYTIANIPDASLQNYLPPQTSTNIDVDASQAGLILTHSGMSNDRSLIAIRGEVTDYYTHDEPLQLSTTFKIHSATMVAGRAGIVFGFVLPGAPVFGVLCEVMHNGGGGAGDLIFRVSGVGGSTDFSLIPGANPTTITELTLTCSLLYDPDKDHIEVSVNSLFPLPGNNLVNSGVIPNIQSGGLFSGNPVSAAAAPPFSFFGAGRVGASARVQYLRFSFLRLGAYITKRGVMYAVQDSEVLSALPNRSESGKLPLQWRQPWIPVAGGRRTPHSSVEVFLEDGSTAIDRVTKSDAPFLFVRYEPQLQSVYTRGLLYTISLSAVEGDHGPWDITGAVFGAVIGEPGSQKVIRLSLIDDLGTRYLGVQMSGTTGLFLADYIRAESDWSTARQYRLLYDPASNGLERSLSVYEDNKTEPLFSLKGPFLDSILPSFTGAPISAPGFYFGLMQESSQVKMVVNFVRYLYNLISYAPHLHLGTSALPSDPGLSYPWSTQIMGTSTEEYVLERDEEGVEINARVRLTSQGAAPLAFYYRDLPPMPTKEHGFNTTDGLVAEFRTKITGTPQNVNNGRTKGIWTGVGMVIDDGVDRALMGFGDAGEQGKFIFVTGPNPTTGAPLLWDEIEDWVADAIRQPKRWRKHLYFVDWSAERLYRFERAAAITSDINARFTVFVDDQSTPSLEVFFRRNGHMDGTDVMETLPGSTARIAWGNLSQRYAVVSEWREVAYSVSVGFDVHVDQLLPADARVQLLVDSDRPVLASMAASVEES